MKRIVLSVALLATLLIPAASWSGESCAMAEKFNGKNLYWNTMCWFDQLIGWE